MKKNEKQILDEVEKTLGSMGNIPILNENPFFYTRLRTAIENERFRRDETDSKSILLKPALLILIAIINIITAVYYFGTSSSSNNADEILINSLKQEYSASQNINYLL